MMSDHKPNHGAAASPRTKAVAAYDRTAAKDRGANDKFLEAPLAILAGAIAAGAVLAALLPASKRERALLNPLTDNIKDRAAAAVSAAKAPGNPGSRSLA